MIKEFLSVIIIRSTTISFVLISLILFDQEPRAVIEGANAYVYKSVRRERHSGNAFQ